MLRALLITFAALTAFAADNSWDKVRDLKTGAELRIFKKGARQPVIGTMDEANDERLIAVVKNEQVAIQKDDIDRIDYRPAPAGKSRPTKETHTTQSDTTQTTPVGPVPQGTRGGPTTSTSTTTSFGGGSKPDFETIYRRTAK